MSLSFKPIKPLLQTGVSKASRWFSYLGLGTGILLMLCSIQMYINVQNLLTKNSSRKDGFDFFSITKNITDANSTQPELTVFNEKEIAELKSQSFITDVAPLLANEFKVYLGAAGVFGTDMFLESIDERFIDTVPHTFTWKEGQIQVPIIISSDYIEIYNVFAPAQGLPVLSSEGAKRIPITIDCSGNGLEYKFQGNFVAYTDRVNSVLVPESFLKWANNTLGEVKQKGPSRLFIKTKDANNPQLLNYLDQKGYKLNEEKTKLGRTKQLLQGIFTGLGFFGLLVVLMALMLFSFYLQLVVARSKEHLQILLLIGYSPRWLGANLSKQFIPVYVFVVLMALAITQLLQWMFHHYLMHDRAELNTMISWIVVLVAIFLLVLFIVANQRLVRKLLVRIA